MPDETSAPLLDRRQIAMLGRLRLHHPGHLRPLRSGQHRAAPPGSSPEFADFRPYASGDDLRRVDWRAYARLDRLVVRLHAGEGEMNVNVVVDASASMGLGTPPKWPAARRLAAAVALVAMGTLDRVAVGVLGDGGSCLRPGHLRGGTGPLLRFLAGPRPGGAAGPGQLAGLGWLRTGVTVVVSDFLSDDPWPRAVHDLGRRGHEPWLWQVLGTDEERPALSGDVRLRDIETGRELDLTVTPRVLRTYREALASLRAELRDAAAAGGGRFLHTTSADSLEAVLAGAVRSGALRRR